MMDHDLYGVMYKAFLILTLPELPDPSEYVYRAADFEAGGVNKSLGSMDRTDRCAFGLCVVTLG